MESWERLNHADEDDAARQLRTCCGSTAWVARMLARRPFASRDDLLARAREEWFALSADDWLEAFAAHPRLGDRDARGERFAATRALSAEEQAGVSRASAEVLEALAEGNRRYEARFGYIFIADASGRSADALLAALHARLTNDPAIELPIAADQQARITARRLLQM
jgi:OHCU decarboxylase